MIKNIKTRKAFKHDVYINSILHQAKTDSKCTYRQVACIIANQVSMLCMGVNLVGKCNEDCENKHSRVCEVTHAEIVALTEYKRLYKTFKRNKHLVAYVNHYPCTSCQIALRKIVGEIRLIEHYKEKGMGHYMRKYGIHHNIVNIELEAKDEI